MFSLLPQSGFLLFLPVKTGLYGRAALPTLPHTLLRGGVRGVAIRHGTFFAINAVNLVLKLWPPMPPYPR